MTKSLNELHLTGIVENTGGIRIYEAVRPDVPTDPLLVISASYSSEAQAQLRKCAEWAFLAGPRFTELVGTEHGQLGPEADSTFVVFRHPAGASVVSLLKERAAIGVALSMGAVAELGVGLIRALSQVQARKPRELDPIPIFQKRSVLVGSNGVRVGPFAAYHAISRQASDSSDPPIDEDTFMLMAPEEVRGLRGSLPGSETYRIGALLYWALCNRPPFSCDEPSLMPLLMAIHSGNREPWLDSVPEPLKEVVDACMHIEIESRPTDLEALVSTLEPFLPRNAGELKAATMRSAAWDQVRQAAARFQLPEVMLVESEKYRSTVYQERLGLAVDRFPVTRQAYREFLQARDRPAPKEWVNGSIPAGTETQPMNWVRHGDAQDYARYRGGRLPTELEWEELTHSDARDFGVVWEWTSSHWPGGTSKVVRGGPWRDQPGRPAKNTNRSTESDRGADVGFRCVYEVGPKDALPSGTRHFGDIPVASYWGEVEAEPANRSSTHPTIPAGVPRPSSSVDSAPTGPMEVAEEEDEDPF